MRCPTLLGSAWRRLTFWVGVFTLTHLSSLPVRAQVDAGAIPAYVAVVGVIRQNSCSSPIRAGDNLGAYVFNLPALQTTLMQNNAFSPVAPLPLRLGTLGLPANCQGGLLGMPTQLSFDGGASPVLPEGGLLRNTATLRPAQNILVQVGLISVEGMFTPLDLNQPQRLNQVLNSPGNAATAGLSLGVRYVAARYVPQQWASLSLPAQAGTLDVTAGNVSAYLPFVLNHK